MITVNKNNFFVRTVQKEQHSPTAPKDTFYAEFRICLALEGEAVWEIENHSHTIRPGDVIFLNIGQRRHFSSFGKAGFKLCALVLTREAFTDLRHFMFFLGQVKNQNNVFKNSPLAPLLTEIFEEWNADRPFRYEFISAKLTEFFIKAERENHYNGALSKRELELLLRMDEIDADIIRGVRLKEIARKAGLSESAFSRRFSAINGVCFKQYAVEKKLQKAMLLLQTTDMKIIDIAMECGFNSISGFYEAFKKKTGASPCRFVP